MKLKIDNVGPIEHLNIEMGKLTVVCGRNNDGKTYLSYILYSLLSTIQHNLSLRVHGVHLKRLLEDGCVHIGMHEYAETYCKAIKEALPFFTLTLPRFMAMHSDKFKNAKIAIDVSVKEICKNLEYCYASDFPKVDGSVEMSKSARLEFRIKKGTDDLMVMLVNESNQLPTDRLVCKAISCMIVRLMNVCMFVPFFPDVFIVTCERTGVALFAKELLDVRERESSYIDTISPDEFDRVCYQLPIEREILFQRNLKSITQRRSFIARKHPEILKMILNMAGGRYEYSEEMNAVKYVIGGKRRGLSLVESSSTVRSLSELFFYLKHCARKGQLLMIDEPELNLHPANQRKVANLLGMLVNVGIRVFVTTHSDYIVRELNTMIRAKLVGENAGRAKCMSLGLQKSSLISAEDVRVYVMQEGTAHGVKYDQCARGFSVRSFDETVRAYNELYQKVLDCEVCTEGV